MVAYRVGADAQLLRDVPGRVTLAERGQHIPLARGEQLQPVVVLSGLVSRGTGRGQAQESDLYRGQEVAPALISKVRIDIACNDAFVKPAVDAILKGAKHNGGDVGDGKIFITALEECIRIRTEERGSEAI